MEPYPLFRADCWDMPMHRIASGCSDYIEVDTPRAGAPSACISSPIQPGAGVAIAAGSALPWAPLFVQKEQAQLSTSLPNSSKPSPFCGAAIQSARHASACTVAAPRPRLPVPVHGPSPLKTSHAEFLPRGCASGPRLAQLPLLPAALDAIKAPAPRAPMPMGNLLAVRAPVPPQLLHVATNSSASAPDCTSPMTAMMLAGCSNQPGVVTPRWGAFDGFDFGCPDADNWRAPRFEAASAQQAAACCTSGAATATTSSNTSEQHNEMRLAQITDGIAATATSDASPASSQQTDTYHSPHVQSMAQDQSTDQQQYQQPRIIRPDDADSADTVYKRTRVPGVFAMDEDDDYSASDFGSDDCNAVSEAEDEGAAGDAARRSSKYTNNRKRVTIPSGSTKKLGKRVICRNCGASQTPQWRCGPEGARTLCNACGVRYKKGLPLAYWERKKQLMAASLV